jgi:hypothetical protein
MRRQPCFIAGASVAVVQESRKTQARQMTWIKPFTGSLVKAIAEAPGSRTDRPVRLWTTQGCPGTTGCGSIRQGSLLRLLPRQSAMPFSGRRARPCAKFRLDLRGMSR